MIRIGSLCTGYGALDRAVEAVTGGTVAWVAESDEHALGAAGRAHAYYSQPW